MKETAPQGVQGAETQANAGSPMPFSTPFAFGHDGAAARPMFLAPNHSLSFDHRRRPEALRTAIATAFFYPTNTTSFLPRVTPV